MAHSYTKLVLRRGLLVGALGFALVSATFGSLSCARKQPTVGERPDTLTPDTLTSDTLTSDTVQESIVRQVGTAACSSPAVCRTLPLGSKPCGGPRRYLVYSLDVTDSARLAADAARYNQAEARRNREEGLVSDCSMLLPPQVSCVSRKCVAVKSEPRRAY
jgi:hypothetical protein